MLFSIEMAVFSITKALTNDHFNSSLQYSFSVCLPFRCVPTVLIFCRPQGAQTFCDVSFDGGRAVRLYGRRDRSIENEDSSIGNEPFLYPPSPPSLTPRRPPSSMGECCSRSRMYAGRHRRWASATRSDTPFLAKRNQRK